MTQVLDLARKLISIPSYVGPGCDEQAIGEFIFLWLKENTKLKIEKQPVTGGRFNVIAKGPGEPRILLVGHIDTVEPRAGWSTEPLKTVIKDQRLYGLGASDMKGSLAVGLSFLSSLKDTTDMMFLAYCDEEYDFAGMRAFVREYGGKITPERIVSLDGSYGSIGNGCRGLIEVSFRLRGTSGHAGRPEAGVNAIMTGVNCLSKLKRQLATKYGDPLLGPTTLNVAYCQGGLDLGNSSYGRQGNNIADIVEFVLDIRPARVELTAESVKSLLSDYLRTAKLTLEDWSVRHDLGSWFTPAQELFSRGVTGEYRPSLGYIDVQMLWEAFGRVPCFTIGAGIGELAHKPDEYVPVSNLDELLITCEQLLNRK